MCFCEEYKQMTAVSADASFLKEPLKFILQDDYEFIGIYSCDECGRKWILDKTSGNNMYTKLNADHRGELMKEWLEHDRIAKHLFDVAKTIGSASEEKYEVPCKAVLISGKELEYCILMRRPFHPRIGWNSIPVKNFVYADEVKNIQPSDYALSLKNRIALRTSQKEIYRDTVLMSLVATDEIYFKVYGNKNYYFDENFLKYKEIKGTDVKLVSQDFEKYKKFTEQESLLSQTTIILFDKF